MKRLCLVVSLIALLVSGLDPVLRFAQPASNPIPVTYNPVISRPTGSSRNPSAFAAPLPPPSNPREWVGQSTPRWTVDPSPLRHQQIWDSIHPVERAAARWAYQAELDRFVDRVALDGSGDLAGVFVPEIFALPVLQQPTGQSGYVSSQDESVTQFSLPEPYGVVGLLAHNYLSGEDFFKLETGQQVALVYRDRRVQFYQINRIERFQALTPNSLYSDFVNLADPQQQPISSTRLFEQVYTTENQLIFQTCIKAGGNASWGRIFIIADPIAPPAGALSPVFGLN